MEFQPCINSSVQVPIICDGPTHSCTTFSDISVNLYITRHGSLQTAKQQERARTVLMYFPLPERNYQSIQWKLKNTASNPFSISFSLQKSYELPSFIKANRHFGFSRSNGFIAAHTATPFLHHKCNPSLYFFA